MAYEYSTSELEVIMEILEERATLKQASQLLRDKGLHHSASSWQFMKEQRLWPGLRAQTLTANDLVALLRDVEEHGYQHIFLYMCRGGAAKAKLLMERERIEAELSSRGLFDILSQPLIFDKPKNPKIVDVRWNGEGEKRRLTLKMVETRQSKSYIGDEVKGNKYFKYWELKSERAVNIIVLHASGLLEMRLHPHSSTKYTDDIRRAWRLSGRILPEGEVNSWNILKAKDALWRRKGSLKNQVSYWTTAFRNDAGTTVTASSGKEDMSLFGDKGARVSMDDFVKHGGFCDKITLHWIGQGDGNKKGPENTVTLRLSGETNEYAIATQCTSADHDFILGKVRDLNR